jgi:hypothetical protein
MTGHAPGGAVYRETALNVQNVCGRTAQPIGHAVADPAKYVRIHERNLIGTHKSFRKENASGRRLSQ